MSDDQDQVEQTGAEQVDTEAEAVVVETEQSEVVDPSGVEQPIVAQPSEVETKARAQGWVPKEEFRGDPSKWRPADEFVKRGEEMLPIALERARTAERRIQDLETQFQQKLARVERVSEIALKRQRDDLETRYAAAMREAAANGDVDRYDQLANARHDVFERFDESLREQTKVEPTGPTIHPDQMQTLQAWLGQNDWFHRDQEMNGVAQAQHMKLLREQPGLSLADNLAATRKYVQQRYPERFGISAKQVTRAAVESGGGRMPVTATRAKGAADLPADVRAVAEKLVKQGLFKDVADYAAEFFADN